MLYIIDISVPCKDIRSYTCTCQYGTRHLVVQTPIGFGISKRKPAHHRSEILGRGCIMTHLRRIVRRHFHVAMVVFGQPCAGVHSFVALLFVIQLAEIGAVFFWGRLVVDGNTGTEIDTEQKASGHIGNKHGGEIVPLEVLIL